RRDRILGMASTKVGGGPSKLAGYGPRSGHSPTAAQTARLAGKLLFSSYREWPCRAIIPAYCPGGGNETPEFREGSRRHGGMTALGRRAAEGDAGDRLPRLCLARRCTHGRRIPPGTK